MNTIMQLSFGLPTLFLLITIWLWYVYGRSEKVVGPVQSFPPKGYNSAETGFLYKGKADLQDVASLLIYLAVMGYVKITEKCEKSLSSRVNGLTITKLKDYEGDNPNERLFLKGLFKYNPPAPSFEDLISYIKNPSAINDAESETKVTEISISNLIRRFYITLKEILTNMNNKEGRHKILEKSSLNKRWLVVLMVVASYLIITLPPMLDYQEMPIALFSLMIPGVGFLMFFLSIFTDAFKNTSVNGMPTTNRYFSLMFGLVFGLLLGILPFVFLVLPALMLNIFSLIAFLTGMICIVLMLLLNQKLKKRTRLGNELLAHIKGVKQHIETADQHKLEELERQHPNYFYKILPYAYVLGVSNVWFKKFERIAVNQPDWYEGNDVFNLADFGRFMNAAMKYAASAMGSTPKKSRH